MAICQNNTHNIEKYKIIGDFLQKRKKSKKRVVFSDFCDMMNEKLSLKSKGVLIYLRTPFSFTGVLSLNQANNIEMR